MTHPHTRTHLVNSDHSLHAELRKIGRKVTDTRPQAALGQAGVCPGAAEGREGERGEKTMSGSYEQHIGSALDQAPTERTSPAIVLNRIKEEHRWALNKTAGRGHHGMRSHILT